MLQEAIQKDGIDRSQYVKGPLTWSEFVRVGDKTCNIAKSDIAPLPIPQLQVQVVINHFCKFFSQTSNFIERDIDLVTGGHYNE